MIISSLLFVESCDSIKGFTDEPSSFLTVPLTSGIWKVGGQMEVGPRRANPSNIATFFELMVRMTFLNVCTEFRSVLCTISTTWMGTGFSGSCKHFFPFLLSLSCSSHHLIDSVVGGLDGVVVPLTHFAISSPLRGCGLCGLGSMGMPSATFAIIGWANTVDYVIIAMEHHLIEWPHLPLPILVSSAVCPAFTTMKLRI